MNDKDPYKILKVKKTATKEQIQTSYRKLVKKHHPDTGGKEEDFKLLDWAYKLLMNAVRRKLYDETGITDEGKDEDTEVMNIISNVFSTALSEVLNGDKSGMSIFGGSASIDIVQHMRKTISQGIDGLKKQLNHCIKSKNKMAELKGELLVDGGEQNHLLKMVDYHINQAEIQIVGIEKEIAKATKALEVLKKYKHKQKESSFNVKDIKVVVKSSVPWITME